MKFRSLAVLLLAGVWGAGSWWWYGCKIKGFCGEPQAHAETEQHGEPQQHETHVSMAANTYAGVASPTPALTTESEAESTTAATPTGDVDAQTMDAVLEANADAPTNLDLSSPAAIEQTIREAEANQAQRESVESVAASADTAVVETTAVTTLVPASEVIEPANPTDPVEVNNAAADAGVDTEANTETAETADTTETVLAAVVEAEVELPPANPADTGMPTTVLAPGDPIPVDENMVIADETPATGKVEPTTPVKQPEDTQASAKALAEASVNNATNADASTKVEEKTKSENSSTKDKAAEAETKADKKEKDKASSANQVTVETIDDGTDKGKKSSQDDEEKTEEKTKTKRVKSIKAARLYFPFESAKPDLSESAEAYLETVVAYLETNPTATITLTGHTDSRGRDDINVRFGLKRAERVRDMLVKLGAPKDRINVDSKGEKQPIADNAEDKGRERNRRVELTPDKRK